MTMEWRDISTAPRDGTTILCWREGWSSPSSLAWKTNTRLVTLEFYEPPNVWRYTDKPNATAIENGFNPSYFGDPWEMDDYDLAKPAGAPTHWMPLPSPPKAPA